MAEALNDGWTYRARVGPDGEREPLVAWLARHYRHTPAAGWSDRVLEGEVEVDGRVVDGALPLRRGQEVAWHRPPWREPEVPLDFTLVHEDVEVVLVSKPSGLPTLPSGGYLRHTLLARVRDRWPEATPMHRLGTGTSGLVVFARTASARRTLQAAWRAGGVERGYRAVLSGRPDWRATVVEVPIGPVPHPLLGTLHAASATGAAARTRFRVVGAHGRHTLADVRIDTGRPHQIRIHAACVGHPLAGDPLFLPGGGARDDVRATDGGYLLHAHVLTLPDLGSGGVRSWSHPASWEAA